MIPERRQRHLWGLADEYRAANPHHFDLFDLANFIRGRGEEVTLDDLRFLVHRFGRGREERVPSGYLSRFVGELLASREVVTALDPAAGMGWLAAEVSRIGHISRFDAVASNPDAERLRDHLSAPVRYRLHIGETAEILSGLGQTFDALVSMPPIGRRGERILDNANIRVRDSESLLCLIDVERYLTRDGVVVWVVPPSFVSANSRRLSVRDALHKLGLNLTALLRIPNGAILPTMGIGAELAVIERTERDSLFVAEIPVDSEAQDQLIARLRNREPGPQPSQGRLVSGKEYVGLTALEARERVDRLAQGAGLSAVDFDVVVLEVNRLRRHPSTSERFAECPDAVYLPEVAKMAATTSQADLPERLQSYFQLIVNRELAEPEYLAGMFNTRLGFALREAASTGNTISMTRPSQLRSLKLYLPPLEDQKRVVNVNRSISQLRTELAELEQRAWDKPRRVRDIVEAVAQVNHEERFEEWIEAIPFPLASVLRAYFATDHTDREKYDRLLLFFEALAEFLATIHLSAFRTDIELWPIVLQRLHTTLTEQHLSFDRSTFGLWKAVVEILAVEARKMLNDKNKQARVMEMYRLVDPRPLERLCARRLLAVLQEANAARNRWRGHGGAVGCAEARHRHEVLREYLESVRSTLGETFSSYQLVEAGESTIRSGPIYQCFVRLLVGSNPQFERGRVELRDPAITNHLYLYNDGHSRVLELAPLVQVRATPQPACYFFNRIEGSITHLVSYHFGEKADEIDKCNITKDFLEALTAPPGFTGDGNADDYASE